MSQSPAVAEAASRNPISNRANTRSVLPACDLCHLKKTRCNRQDPCSSCQNAGTLCARKRERQINTKRPLVASDQLDAVLKRMSSLEEYLMGNGGQAREATEAPTVAVNATRPPVISTPMIPLKRRYDILEQDSGESMDGPSQVSNSSRRPQSTPTSPHESCPTGSATDPNASEPSVVELDQYLEPQATQEQAWDKEKRMVFQAAIAVAKQVALYSPTIGYLGKHAHRAVNFYDPTMYPPAEALRLILRSDWQNLGTRYYLDLFVNISQQDLEFMAAGLIGCSIHGQARIQHLICVNYAAYSYNVASRSNLDSKQMQDQLQKVERRYRDNVLLALDYLKQDEAPTFGLFQALFCGAMLMQELGAMKNCWHLITKACKVCVALDHLSFGHELHVMRIKCFIYDKALSANIYQPACMENLRIDQSVLDESKESHSMLIVMLKLSRIFETLVIVTSEDRSSGASSTSRTQLVMSALNRVTAIKKDIYAHRTQAEEHRDDYLSFEWKSIDLILYSTTTSLLKLKQKGNEETTQAEMLENARNALSCLRWLLDCAVPSVPHQAMCLNSMSWLVPLFVPRPLYHIFSNVVTTSNALDLKLLHDLAARLTNTAKNVPALSAVSHLCNSLVQLYEEYSDNVLNIEHTPALPGSATNYDRTPSRSLSQLNSNRDITNKIGDTDLHLRVRPMNQSSPHPITEPRTIPRIAPFGSHAKEQISQPGGMEDALSYGQELSDTYDESAEWELFYMQPALDGFDLDFDASKF